MKFLFILSRRFRTSYSWSHAADHVFLYIFFFSGSWHKRDQTSEISSQREEGEPLPVCLWCQWRWLPWCVGVLLLWDLCRLRIWLTVRQHSPRINNFLLPHGPTSPHSWRDAPPSVEAVLTSQQRVWTIHRQSSVPRPHYDDVTEASLTLESLLDWCFIDVQTRCSSMMYSGTFSMTVYFENISLSLSWVKFDWDGTEPKGIPWRYTHRLGPDYTHSFVWNYWGCHHTYEFLMFCRFSAALVDGPSCWCSRWKTRERRKCLHRAVGEENSGKGEQCRNCVQWWSKWKWMMKMALISLVWLTLMVSMKINQLSPDLLSEVLIGHVTHRKGHMTLQLIRLNPVHLCVMQEVETIVKASVITPDTKGQIHTVQEPPETLVQPLSQECTISVGGGERELG